MLHRQSARLDRAHQRPGRLVKIEHLEEALLFQPLVLRRDGDVADRLRPALPETAIEYDTGMVGGPVSLPSRSACRLKTR